MTPQLISCDESGYTGPNLTDASQPLFSYAAVAISQGEAASLIDSIRSRRRRSIQAPELKAASLRAREDWPDIASEVVSALAGRFSVITFDKRLALAGKVFEYVYEPVLQRNNRIFYSHGMHLYVTHALYRMLSNSESPVEIIAKELETFMRTFNTGDAPSIFVDQGKPTFDSLIFQETVRFARGYQGRLEAATHHLRHGVGRWALDLTSTAFTSLLAGGLAQQYTTVKVLCDESKPLIALNDFFAQWVGRNEWIPISAGNHSVRWRLNLSEPIVFGRSVDHPSLQIADILAGITVELYGSSSTSKLNSLRSAMDCHLHSDCISADDVPASSANSLEDRVNRQVLRYLASRAELHQDPLVGIDSAYRAAIKRFSHPASRIGRKKSRTVS